MASTTRPPEAPLRRPCSRSDVNTGSATEWHACRSVGPGSPRRGGFYIKSRGRLLIETRGPTMATPSPKFVIATILGTSAYLALAVLGWGSFAAFFAHPARIALTVVTFLLAGAALFTSGNVSPGVREDRSNRWVIAALGVIGIATAYFPALTDRLDVWTIDGDAVRWSGITLYVIGGALRLYPVFVLGNRFSGLVAIQPGHTLVTTGIYSVIRHPSYLGLLVNSLGWALVFRSTIGVLLAALTIIPLVARMNAEEALLRSQFGAEYESLMARTSRFIPGVY